MQITEKAVEDIVRARRVLMPLLEAAEFAGVEALAAQAWLHHGRVLGPTRRPTEQPWQLLCRRLAVQWDQAEAEALVGVREMILEHARKTPSVAIQLLYSLERDHSRRTAHRASRLLLAEQLAKSELPGTDLEESYQGLALSSPLIPSNATAREMAQLSRTTTQNADGTTTQTETVTAVSAITTSFEDDMAGRSTEELDYYAEHGYWPGEAHVERTADVDEIDTVGEVVDDTTDLVHRELMGKPAEADPAAAAELAIQLAQADHEPDPPSQKARRLPDRPLREIGVGDTEETLSKAAEDAQAAAQAATAPPLPPFERAKRYDPLARR